MVAADNAVASQVGANILQQGGDAVDAAAAVALYLGVVQPFASGIGGGGFAVVHRTAGESYSLDFREMAPAAAHRDMYLDKDGNVVPNLSTRGPKAAGVPGEVAGLYELHKRHGKLPWATVVEPALRAARDGFPVGSLLHKRIQSYAKRLSERPRFKRQFLDTSGQPLLPGSTLVRSDLARTLMAISQNGASGFYKGSVAGELVRAMKADGGLITQADLDGYTVRERALVRDTVMGFDILSMPPPSSGGAVVIATLKALEAAPLKDEGHNSSAYLHRLAEALKHTFADRARVMGDPDFTQVPLDKLISVESTKRIQEAFNPKRTLPREAYGGKYAIPEDGGTSHFSIVDSAGNAVALTTTVNTGFGSLYIAGDTGIILNNEMDDFVSKPGVPNSFGLIGNAANAVAPKKRPLSSMSPTIVIQSGRVRLVVGASGGPTIITGTLQVMLNVLVFGMDIREAIESPRIHHQWVPEVLWMERSIPVDVRRALEARGHAIKVAPRFNSVQGIEGAQGGWFGASDPSKQGAPAGSKR
jgi:gamma-glutamyltranspeptidase/glutathione hydrolase